MSQEINLGGTIYISSRRGAEITGYSQDYIGQLARSGAIEAQRVSGLWYILENSLRAHKEKAEQFTPIPPQKIREIEQQVSVSFGGKDYISASRASEISGYNPDYVTQLAREGKILAHQSANRWFIDRESLLKHKAEKDSLLAAVQSDAVGIRDTGDILDNSRIETVQNPAHFNYVREDSNRLMPIEVEDTTNSQEMDYGDTGEIPEEEISIPIRGVKKYHQEETKVHSESVPNRPIRPFFLLGALVGAMLILGGSLLFLTRPAVIAGLRDEIKIPKFLESIIANEIVFSRAQDF